MSSRPLLWTCGAHLSYAQSAQQQLIAATAQQTAAQLALDAVQQRYNVGAATLLEITQARSTRECAELTVDREVQSRSQAVLSLTLAEPASDIRLTPG